MAIPTSRRRRRTVRARHVGIAALSWLIVACQTTPDRPEPEMPEGTHFVLEQGPVEPQVKPLPDLIPIWVRYYHGEALVDSRLGYRGWDFNGDGGIDMLEVLEQDGSGGANVYDFDFDGHIDRVKKKGYHNSPMTNHNQ